MGKRRRVKTRTFIILSAAAICLSASGSLGGQPGLRGPDRVLAAAREAYNDRDFETAAREYGRYLELHPGGRFRDEAGFFHAQSLFLLRRYQEADRAFKKEEDLNKEYADQVLYYRAEIASLMRRDDQALVLLDRLESRYPDSPLAGRAEAGKAELHMRQGDRCLSSGAYSLALQHYRQADSSYRPGPGATDKKAELAYKTGLCHHLLGNYQEAVKVWGDLSMMEAPEAGEAPLLAGYRMARALEDRGMYAEAELSYQRFLDRAPGGHYLAPLAAQGLARVWAAQGKTERALEYWREKGPARQLLQNTRIYGQAVEHFIKEEHQDAAEAFSSVAAGTRDRELRRSAYVMLARSCMEDGRTGKALEAFEKAMEAGADPGIEYAEAALELKPEKSLAMADSLLEGEAAPPEAPLGIRAAALCALKRPEAPVAATEYLARYPEGGRAGELHLCRARRALAEGDRESAQQDLQAAVRLLPEAEKRVNTALQLAELYRQDGRVESAGKVLEEAEAEAGKAYSLEGKIKRAEARIAFSRGEASKSAAIYQQLCHAGEAGEDSVSIEAECSADDLFRLFRSHDRAGETEKADGALEAFESAGGDPFLSGLWRGMMSFRAGEYKAAVEAWSALEPDAPFQRALLAWQTASALEAAGEPDRAMKALASIESGSGLYPRGRMLSLALDSGDAGAYLAALPDPSELDRETLSEQALIAELRRMEEEGAEPSSLEALNRILQVQAASENTAEEGVLIVARAGLYGPGRPEAIAMLDSILRGRPQTPFAAEIKLYRAEDAFFRKNYRVCASWLEGVEPEDVPEKLRFRLLYLKGRAYKELRELEKMRPCFLDMARGYGDEEGTADEWLNAGVGLTLVHEFNAAEKALAIASAKSEDKDVLAEAAYWTGMAQLGSGRRDAALETFLNVHSKYPDKAMWAATALYEAAGIYAEKKEYDQALELYRRVLKLARGDKSITGRVKAKMAEVKKLKRQG